MTTVVDLGKLRFYWAGAYDETTEYELNDIVKYGGNVYVYINVVRTVGTIPTNVTYWALMVEGINFVGEWDSATQYFIGDAIAYGSTVYVALQDNINQQPDNFPAVWSQFAEGIQFEGVYSSATTYQKNDVVSYGPSAFIAKTTTNNNDPTNTTYWDPFVSGISPEGVYNNATAYVDGDVVAYGANLYVAKGNTTGNVPTNTTYWDLFIDTIRIRGNWGTSTEYFINDIVVYGGNTYACIVQHTSGTFATDLSADKWQVFNGGIRWRGEWATTTPYLVNDVVRNGGSSYIATEDFTSGANFSVEFDAGKWVFFTQGGDDVLPVLVPGLEGFSLTVDSTGTGYDWINASGAPNVLFVSKSGSDSNPGTSLATPFLTIQAAVAAVPVGQKTAIYVKSGTYAEVGLPIVVPSDCAVIGDSIRSTFVTPASGLAADGVTPNNEATMWLLSDGSLLHKMSFSGMTGWVPGATAADITTSTPKGIFCALNPATPITHKSPYVLECSSFSTGGIGAYVDGSVHASGNKSMLFHQYTNIHDNGVGLWIDNNAKTESVSSFTYYCYFGYASTNGGQIRSLSGNNSYGEYGAYSSGFDATEAVITGSVYGSMLTLTGPYSGIINPGDTITSSAGGTATITSAQTQTLYVADVTGTFSDGDTFTTTSGGTGTITSLGGQRNFILVLDNLTALPNVGQSIQIAGDTSAYVIQNVSGSYVDATSVIVVALAQEKPTASADDAQVTVRANFSLLRITGHDFLNIGTGGVTTTNYPGIPSQNPDPSKEVVEDLPGRVYYVSTDQAGNFNVGQYFSVNQATGSATLNANAFNLSGLTELRLGSIGAQLGAQINEFSVDGTMAQNSAVKVPTQSAVVTYVGNRVPQPIPSSVGNDGKVLTSNGGSLAFSAIEALPNPEYANGMFLFTDGADAYWDSSTQIVGQNTFSFVSGASFSTTTYTATSLTTTSPTFSWSVDYDALPPGITAISINTGTGALSMTGTFTTDGFYPITVSATDGKFVGRMLVRVYVAATAVIPVFNTTTSNVSNVVEPGAAVSIQSFQASNTGGGITYELVSGNYPDWLTFSAATGEFSGTAPTINSITQRFVVVVSATAGGVTVDKTFKWDFGVFITQGQALFGTNVGTGTFSWVAPAGVTSVSVVAIGAGANSGTGGSGLGTGSGGGLGWKNNIPVVPGTTYTVQVAARGGNRTNGSTGLIGGNSFFINTSTVAGYGGSHYSTGITTGGPNANGFGGGWFGDGGGAGGNTSGAYQGAGSGGGGYSGRGANSGGTAPAGGGGGSGTNYSSTYGYSGGGGVGLLGEGPSGLSGLTPSTPNGGGPGGAGGAGSWNGPSGGVASFSTVSYPPNSLADNNLGRGSRGQIGENPYNSTGEGGNTPLAGGNYGGGGGGAGDGWPSSAGFGGQGGVRIIWGPGRAFPATNTADVTPQP